MGRFNFQYRNGKWYKGNDSSPLPDHYKVYSTGNKQWVYLNLGNAKYVSSTPADILGVNGSSGWGMLINSLSGMLAHDLATPTSANPTKSKDSNLNPTLNTLGKSEAYLKANMASMNAASPLDMQLSLAHAYARQAQDEIAKDYNNIINKPFELSNKWLPTAVNSLLSDTKTLDGDALNTYLKYFQAYTNQLKAEDSNYDPLDKTNVRENILNHLFGNNKNAALEYVKKIREEYTKEGKELTPQLEAQLDYIAESTNYGLALESADIADEIIYNKTMEYYKNNIEDMQKKKSAFEKKYGMNLPGFLGSISDFMTRSAMASSSIIGWEPGKNNLDFGLAFQNKLDIYNELVRNVQDTKSLQLIKDMSDSDIEKDALMFDTMAEQAYGSYNSNKAEIINEGMDLSGADSDKVSDKEKQAYKARLYLNYVQDVQVFGAEVAAQRFAANLQRLNHDRQGVVDWIGDTLNGAARSVVGTAAKMGSIISQELNPYSLTKNLVRAVYYGLDNDDNTSIFDGFASDWDDALNNSVSNWAEDLETTGMWWASNLNKAKAGETYTAEEILNLVNKGIITSDKELQAYKKGYVRKNIGDSYGKWIVEQGHEKDILSASAASNVTGVIMQMVAVGGVAKALSFIGEGMVGLSEGLGAMAEEASAMGKTVGTLEKLASFTNKAGVITEASAPSIAASALDFGYAKSAYDENVMTIKSAIYNNPEVGELNGFTEDFKKKAAKYYTEHPEKMNYDKQALKQEVDLAYELARKDDKFKTIDDATLRNMVNELIVGNYFVKKLADKTIADGSHIARNSAAIAWGLTTLPDAALAGTLRATIFQTEASKASWNTVKGWGAKGLEKLGISRTAELAAENSLISSVTKQGEHYAVHAAEEGTRKAIGKSMWNNVKGGFISNYLQDVGVGINKGGFNTAWDNYINIQFDHDKNRTTRSVILGFIMGGLEAAVDKLSFYDGAMGAIAGPLTPHIHLGESKTTDNIVKRTFDAAKGTRVSMDLFNLAFNKETDAIKQTNNARREYAKQVETWLNSGKGAEFMSHLNEVQLWYEEGASNSYDDMLHSRLGQMTSNAEFLMQLSKADFFDAESGEVTKGKNPVADIMIKNLKYHAERGKVTADDINIIRKKQERNAEHQFKGEPLEAFTEKEASIINDINSIGQETASTLVIYDLMKRLDQISDNAKEQLLVYQDMINATNKANTYLGSKGVTEPVLLSTYAKINTLIKATERLAKKYDQDLSNIKAKILESAPTELLNENSSFVIGDNAALYALYGNDINTINDRKQAVADIIANRSARINEINRQLKELKKTRKDPETKRKKEAKSVRKQGKLTSKKLDEINDLLSEIYALDREKSALIFGKETSENETADNFGDIEDKQMSMAELKNEHRQLSSIIKQDNSLVKTDLDEPINTKRLSLRDIISLDSKNLAMLLLANQTKKTLTKVQEEVFNALNLDDVQALTDAVINLKYYNDTHKELKRALTLGIENLAFYQLAVQQGYEDLVKAIYSELYKNFADGIDSYQAFVAKYEGEINSWKDLNITSSEQSKKTIGLHTALENNQFFKEYQAQQGKYNQASIKLGFNFNKIFKEQGDDVIKENTNIGRGILRYFISNLNLSIKEMTESLKNINDTLIELLKSYLTDKGYNVENIDLKQAIIEPMLTYLNLSAAESKRLDAATKGKATGTREKQDLHLEIKADEYVENALAALSSFIGNHDGHIDLLKQLGISQASDMLNNEGVSENVDDILDKLSNSSDISTTIQELSNEYSDLNSLENAVIESIKLNLELNTTTTERNRSNTALKVFTSAVEQQGLAPEVGLKKGFTKALNGNMKPFTLTDIHQHPENWKNGKPHVVKLMEDHNVDLFLLQNTFDNDTQAVFLYNPALNALSELGYPDSMKNEKSLNANKLIAVAVKVDGPTNTGNPIEINGEHYLIIGFLPGSNSTTNINNTNIIRDNMIGKTDNTSDDTWSILTDSEGNAYTSYFTVERTDKPDEENFRNPEARRLSTNDMLSREGNSAFANERYVIGADGYVSFKVNVLSAPVALYYPQILETINTNGNTIEEVHSLNAANVTEFNHCTKGITALIKAVIETLKSNPNISPAALNDAINGFNEKGIRVTYPKKKSIFAFTPTQNNAWDFKNSKSDVVFHLNLYLADGYSYRAEVSPEGILSLSIITKSNAPTRTKGFAINRGPLISEIEGTRVDIDMNASDEEINQAIGDWIYNLSKQTYTDQSIEKSLVKWQINNGMFRDGSGTLHNPSKTDVTKEQDRRNSYRKACLEEGLLQYPPRVESATVTSTSIQDTNAKKALEELNKLKTAQAQAEDGSNVDGLSETEVPVHPAITLVKELVKTYNKILGTNQHGANLEANQLEKSDEGTFGASNKKGGLQTTFNAGSKILGNIADSIFRSIVKGKAPSYTDGHSKVMTLDEFNTLTNQVSKINSFLTANNYTVVSDEVSVTDTQLYKTLVELGQTKFLRSFLDLLVMGKDGNLAVIDCKTHLGEHMNPNLLFAYWQQLNLYAYYLNQMLATKGIASRVTKIHLFEIPLAQRQSGTFTESATTQANITLVTRDFSKPILDGKLQVTTSTFALMKPERILKIADERSNQFLLLYGKKTETTNEEAKPLTLEELKSKFEGKTFSIDNGQGLTMIMNITYVDGENFKYHLIDDQGEIVKEKGKPKEFDSPIDELLEINKDPSLLEVEKKEAPKEPPAKKSGNDKLDEGAKGCHGGSRGHSRGRRGRGTTGNNEIG